MPTLLQINITANWGSHGKIAEGIGKEAIAHGWKSYIAYGRWFNPSKSAIYHIGNNFDEAIHIVGSRLLDNHGLMSSLPTKKLISFIENIKPDIIHLHNIHGYYLNYSILFDYLAKINIPIVWTLHDCWTFTGHCAHYMFIGCDKWQTHCNDCPLKSNYPRSIWKDNSERNFELKRKKFLSVKNLTLVPVSKWLEGDLKKSFFKKANIHQIYNGINTDIFQPSENASFIVKQKYNIPSDNKIILGVASNWYRKGLHDFISLRTKLDMSYTIILVGLTPKVIKTLPSGIIGIQRTENINELVNLYSAANVYFNPTWEDNFPTTNIEAMSCGTPVVVYNTGGCAETINKSTGIVVDKGNLVEAKKHIMEICSNDFGELSEACRQNVVDNYKEETCYNNYLRLYNSLVK